ncbi:hypothetical protein IQ229_10445 [Nostoc cf. edaphicum LEGE 07299]|uniref:Uncharacterized protein n=1 Tax=Nostoc cf. edaphicum LEGE 07299 TaxID=2777974 RepID=A0ABR9U0G8_9NOSO|nr:hypothetical protein [Nostoc edaphicum]MBE9105345.1 hypothetical protein [Nostoc cf. edaphicum LEGE 07299]
MLNKYIDLIEKHPIRLAAAIAVIGGLGSLPYMVFQMGAARTNQEQAQVQAPVGGASDDMYDMDTEPFDRTKCKVYNMGMALGAWVFQFKGTDGKLDYMLFTDDLDVIQTFDRSPFGIFWWSSSGFRDSDYPEIAKVLPPEGLKELDALLDNYSYAAIGTTAFANAVQQSANAGLLNTCDVD